MLYDQVRTGLNLIGCRGIPDNLEWRENMNCNLIASERAPHGCRPIHRAAYLLLLIWCTLICVMFNTAVFAQTADGTVSSAPPAEIRVIQILGFEGTSSNAKGKLSIQDDALQFKKEKADPATIKILSIQNVVLGEQNKQVGGLPMTVGKAAVPYGGGRVISLFSHKKFDTLTLEYLSPNGAFHGAIFQLEKGQAQTFRDQLVAKGAHIIQVEDQSTKQSTSEVPSESK
jgi:hypothetical protein